MLPGPGFYGQFESDRWTLDDIIVKQRTIADKTPTFSTAGVDKALASMHYDKIFCDDLENRQTVGTPEQRNKTKLFYSDALDLLEPTGVMYFIGTRWHDDDVYGWFLDRKAKGDFQDIVLEVYVVKATTNGDVDGPVIFPNKFNNRILRGLLSEKGPYEFNAQYMNDPIPESSSHFPAPVRYWNEIGDGAIHYVSFDPATAEKKDSCDAVVMDACINRANQLMAVEYKAFQQKNPEEMIAKIFEFMVPARGPAAWL